ncbi:MAG: biopolymer transporter ExbD [Bacteroidota bacterium]
MGLKKKSKVNAQFNTSALTDIIFLLLIFFMLTSSLVAPNALNMKLPSSSRTKAPTAASKIDEIMIRSNGRYFLNDRRIELADMEAYFAKKVRRNSNAVAAIANSSDATNGDVVAVMDMALRLNLNTVLTTDL